MTKFYVSLTMRWIILLGLFFATSYNLFAQSTANYAFATTTDGSMVLDMNGNTINMSSGTTQIHSSSVDDAAGSTNNMNLGSGNAFTFFFMGTAYTQFTASSNGVIRLGSSAVSSTTYNIPIASQALISPFGCDLQTGTNGSVRAKVVGTFPNRCLVIEYSNVMIFFASTVTAGNGSFQARLYEKGTIEFVYADMVRNSNTSGLGEDSVTIGFSNTNTANNFITVNTSAHTVNTTSLASVDVKNFYAASATITDLNSSSDGSRRRYSFIPPAATAPSGLNFTAIGATAMTLNWTDNATGEIGYLISNSLDGTTYTPVAVTATNVQNYIAGGLTPSTNYFWKVNAISAEGGYSADLSNNQGTNAASFSGTKTIGASGADYTSITAAISAATSGALSGAVVLSLQSDYVSSSETFPITIGNISGNSASNTITIQPASSGLSITSANTTATFDLNAAKNIIIDGRVNAAGSAKDLVIENTATAGVAIRFINDATSNTVKYAVVKGVNTSTSNGVISFLTTTATTGNDNNTIDNCDVRDGTTTPVNGIYSAGTSSKENSGNTISNCNVFNFFSAGSATVGINISSNNSDWTITNNKLYQESSRTYTSGNTHKGIGISSGNNHSITGNTIGYTSASTTGTYTLAGSTATRYMGIDLAVGTTSPTSVQNNTIANFSLATSSGSSSGIFIGINITSGNVNVGTSSANTIGSTSTADVIACTPTTNGALIAGIISSSTGTVSISNNNIGGLTGLGAAAIGTLVKGIVTSGTSGNYTIASNTIGSSSTANSMRAGVAGTTTALCNTTGIENSATGTISITSNLIANLIANGSNTSSIARGIINSNGTTTISQNTIRNISTVGANTGTTTSSAIIGISQTSTTAGITISQNTIHTLSNTAATGTVSIIGIHYNGASSGTNVVSRNLIHSFSLSSSGVGLLYGLNTSGGTTTYQNNMIRLGIDASGSSITAAYDIRGINDASGTNNYYHNSVYIGGTGVASGTTNTFAFTSAVTNPRIFQNNIFYNARSNASGTGLNVAYFVSGTFPGAGGLNSNNNLVYANGTGGALFRNSTTNYTMNAWRVASGGMDLLSHTGDPGFVAPTGNSTTIDLHITGTTPAEANGVSVVAVTDDYDGQARSGLTAVDIGADAGNFTSSDMSAPSVNFVPLGNRTSTNTSLASFVTATDNIAVSATSKPRFYYKKSTDADAFVGNTSSDNGWKYVIASNSSSPYSFTIDYSIVNGGSVANGDAIQYFVVAQDDANNLFSLPADATASTNPPVENINAKPTTVGSYNIAGTLSGTVNVGSGETYTTLTGASGLFADINSKVLSGNLIVNITSDVTETGANALASVNEEPAGSNFTITIQPNAASTRILSATAVTSGNPMININGADNVTIDGRSGGSGQFLTFRNTNSTAANTGATVQFNTGSVNCLIRNCIIESNATTATRGTVTVGNAGTNNITISNNNIRDAIGGTTGAAANGIYSNNPGNTINVSSNNIFNNTSNGILFTSVADACTIADNSIYHVVTANTAQNGISVQAGNNHAITGNFIGGSAANCGGTAWTNSGAVAFRGMLLGIGITTATSIQNNTIQNISMSSTGASTFSGIEVTAGRTNIGTSTGNTIGHSSTASSISVAGTSTTIAINISSSTATAISNNLIANIVANNTGTGVSLRGISYTGTSTGTISSNTIRNLSSTSANTTFTSTQTVAGIVMNNAGTGHVISGNTINAIQATNSGAVSNSAQGMVLVNSSITGTITGNKIFDITNVSTSTSAVINGINFDNGDWITSNNMISITNGANINDPIIRGIFDNTGTSRTLRFFYNTVRIGGTASSTTNTFAYNRAIAATVEHKNNIYINERSGGTGKHYAFANTAGTPATGWSASASNYNNVYSTASAVTALWGSTDQTLAQFQTSSSGDVNSKSADVNFTNETNADFHIAGASIGDANLNGISVSVTSDFDGDLRPAISPYMGADEILATPLPVDLLTFSGSVKDNAVSLNWSTASEINSDYFSIERMSAKEEFAEIGRVSASRNKRLVTNYKFIDNQLQKGVNTYYYRLNMFDRNGTSKYSNVISVSMTDKGMQTSVYPNPSSGLVFIMVDNPSAEKVHADVIDIFGKTISSFEIETDGSSVYPADLSSYPKGIYMIRIVSGENTQVMKIDLK